MECRICRHPDEVKLINPCKCTDPVHLECLEEWRCKYSRNPYTCEVCNNDYTHFEHLYREFEDLHRESDVVLPITMLLVTAIFVYLTHMNYEFEYWCLLRLEDLARYVRGLQPERIALEVFNSFQPINM